MGLLHKLIAYPEIGTVAPSTPRPTLLSHQSVLLSARLTTLRQLFADDVFQTNNAQRVRRGQGCQGSVVFPSGGNKPHKYLAFAPHCEYGDPLICRGAE